MGPVHHGGLQLSKKLRVFEVFHSYHSVLLYNASLHCQVSMIFVCSFTRREI